MGQFTTKTVLQEQQCSDGWNLQTETSSFEDVLRLYLGYRTCRALLMLNVPKMQTAHTRVSSHGEHTLLVLETSWSLEDW